MTLVTSLYIYNQNPLVMDIRLLHSCHFLSNATVNYLVITWSNLVMSNQNGLLSQKLYHYLNQGCTLNDMLMRAAH